MDKQIKKRSPGGARSHLCTFELLRLQSQGSVRLDAGNLNAEQEHLGLKRNNVRLNGRHFVIFGANNHITTRNQC